MIKNYLPVFVVVTFLLAFFPAKAQVAATDDYAEIPFQTNAIMVIPNLLANDLVAGQPANLGNVTFGMADNNSPYISIEADGSVWFTPTALASPQVYFVQYRVSEIADPLNYDIGTVTVNVGGCLTPNLTASNPVTPTCINSGSVTIDNLPGGNWILTHWRDGVLQPQINGSGTSYTAGNLMNGIHHFSVFAANNCQSIPIRMNLFSTCYVRIQDSGQYVDLNGDNFVSPGDVVNYEFSVTNNREVTITAIHFSTTSPLMTLGADYLEELATGATDNTTFTGVRLITQADINAGYVSSRVELDATINSGAPLPLVSATNATTYLNISDGIRLNAFLDLNANGTQDAGEINFTKGSFNYEVNGDGIIHHVNTNGSLVLYENNPTNSYNFGFDFDTPSPYYLLQTNSFQNITIADGSGTTAYNFPIAILPHNDLSVAIAPLAFAPRPGFGYSNRITFRNNGTSTQSGTVTFEHGSAVSIASVSEAEAAPTPNGFTVAFSNLQPNETRNIHVSLTVPTIPSVALGDLISATATISLAPDDVDPTNNSDTLTQRIVGGYDPNDKTEAHGGKITHAEFSADDYLTYTIRFENTGNANAINVRINDLLDEKLDENTVKMVDASHDYKLDRVDNNLSWRFDAIQLPPSIADTEIGHGFVTFRVKPKIGYSVGDIIPNSADIYFDFNPAIVTEPCLTEFVSVLDTESFETATISLYPNPVSTTLNIDSKNNTINRVVVTNALSQEIIDKTINSLNTTIDFAPFSKGIYFVTLQSGSQNKTYKVIRQ